MNEQVGQHGDVKREEPGGLGLPISDDSSEDEASQIRGLEEDRGIYHHEEVVASPKYESDEDIPIPGSKQAIAENMERDTESRMGRRRSVRFTGPYDTEEDGQNPHLRSPSPESMSYIKALENPMAVRDGESPTRDDDFNELVNGPKTLIQKPLDSPPAYTSGDESFNKPAAPALVEPVKEQKKTRSSLNELLITKVAQPLQAMIRRASRMEDDSNSDHDDDDDDDDDFTEEEIQVLTYIDAYRPSEIELRPMLRPFLLEFMPSIGDIDAFIKVPRPDDVDDNAGITHLDEPATQQSDATILSMQLRNASKEVTSNMMDDPPVKFLSRADKHADQIEQWIANIKELQKTKPAQTVHYKGVMPDIDSLMQEMPEKLEEALRAKKVQLPTADLDCSLEEYVDICLNICDIPVGKSRIQALHLMFSLLTEFNNSQHFRNLAVNNQKNGETGETMDRLEL